MRIVVRVVVGASGALDLAGLFALVQLAFCGFCALDAFEAGAATLGGDVDAASIVLGEDVLDAAESAGSTDGLYAVALALCGATREAGGA